MYKKRWVFGLLILVMLGILIIYAEKISVLEEDQKIAENIVGELKAGNKIDFQKIIDGEWDSMVIVGPYTPRKKAEKFCTVKLDKIKHYRMDYSDSETLLVFCKGRQVLKYAYLKNQTASIDWSQSRGEFHLMAFPKTASTFRVVEQRKGKESKRLILLKEN